MFTQLGYIVDKASEKLASVRTRRSENKVRLRALMEEQARLAFSKGSSDSRSVSIMRGRFCISIKVREYAMSVTVVSVS
jgi:hypothetical protein